MTNDPRSIVLYSVGLLGGSIGLALKASGYRGKIIGLSSPGAIATALELGCIDEGFPYTALESVMSGADCLFLCSPIQVIMATIERLGPMTLRPGCIITDVGSTKSRIMDAARLHLPPHVHFIGGHPMAGSEKHGPMASDPYLFQNAMYVLTPAEGTPADVAGGFAEFLERNLGCRHITLEPQVHDTIAAMVSHTPHLLAVALVNVAAAMDGRIPGTLSLAAGGFRDMTRIASAPYAMWHDILATNKERIGPVIDDIIAALTAMKRHVGDDGLKTSFAAAAATRSAIPASSKGFMSAVSDVFVIVKDQPGMIALMANACAAKNINIKDIEVLKVRENQGGTMRLSFETKDIAARAAGIFKDLGIAAWERE
jgi:prephenate dehydrogenase